MVLVSVDNRNARHRHCQAALRPRACPLLLAQTNYAHPPLLLTQTNSAHARASGHPVAMPGSLDPRLRGDERKIGWCHVAFSVGTRFSSRPYLPSPAMQCVDDRHDRADDRRTLRNDRQRTQQHAARMLSIFPVLTAHCSLLHAPSFSTIRLLTIFL